MNFFDQTNPWAQSVAHNKYLSDVNICIVLMSGSCFKTTTQICKDEKKNHLPISMFSPLNFGKGGYFNKESMANGYNIFRRFLKIRPCMSYLLKLYSLLKLTGIIIHVYKPLEIPNFFHLIAKI